MITRKWLINALIVSVAIILMVLQFNLPGAFLITHAQDVPDQPPTDVPTDAAVEAPTGIPTETPVDISTSVPTPEPTSEPTLEVTATPTLAETAEPTAEASPTPPPAPTEPPKITVFSDDFEDGETSGWLLTAGWMLAVENDNHLLTSAEPGQTAAVENLSLANFSLSARVRVADGGSVSLMFNAAAEAYTLNLDAAGHTTLYRSGLPVAAGPQMPALPDGMPAPWRTINLTNFFGAITVTLDGALNIAFTDPAPLPAGAITFSTGADSSGQVSLDQITISQLEIAPTPIPTWDVTENPTLEPTSEFTIEPTSEPTSAPTVEPTPPVTEEVPVGRVILSADFEGDLTGWTLSEGAAIAPDGDSNHVLALAAGSSLFPAEALSLTAFSLSARLSLLDAEGISIPFRTGDGSAYALVFDTTQTALYRNKGDGLALLAAAPAEHVIGVWYTLLLEAHAGHLTFTVNETLELDVTDAEPLLAGSLAFLAAGAALLDDVIVTDFAPAEVIASPTPAPLILTDDARARLGGALAPIIEAYVEGGEAAALELSAVYFVPLDDEGLFRVILWPAEGSVPADLAPLAQLVGGFADYVHADSVEARLPLAGLIALINLPEIGQITPAALAFSTGSAAAPAAGTVNAPAGSVFSQGFDLIGANDWHTAGFTGQNQRIAVIDTGFSGLAAVPAAERSCVAGAIPTGGTTHGARVVEVLCDIAPGAQVRLYRADNAAQLATQIAVAASTSSSHNNNIILITMDVGADYSGGDGSGGSVYTNLAAARAAGRLVIVSAGNSYGRYVSFSGSGSVTIRVTGSDVVRVRSSTAISAPTWSGVGGLPAFTATGGTGNQGWTATVPNVAACQNDYPNTTIRNYCDLTVNVTSSGYVQVQVQTSVTNPLNAERTSIINQPGGANTQASLGRPADSADVLTVGAICANATSPEIMPDSSRGPIFGAGGTAPAGGGFTARGQFKPDLSGPSDVSTSDDVGTPSCDSDDNERFGGTSAAAAHIAGLAALVRSNAALGLDTPQELTDYMQSHTVDFALSGNPDGFDMAHGAGLAVLGNPAPAYGLSSSPTAAIPTSVCDASRIRYVRPLRPGDAADVRTFDASYGSLGNPFIHPAHALYSAASSACVILLPGEYVSGILVDFNIAADVRLRSYDSALNNGRLTDGVADSIIWTNFNNGGVGGFQIRNVDAADNFSLEGLRFFSGVPINPVGSERPIAIRAANADTVRISSSTFSGFSGAPPIYIETSSNITIQGSTFENNDNGGNGAAMTIASNSTGIVVQNNIFRNNRALRNGSLANPSEGVIGIFNSAVDLYNNRFVSNTSIESIIQVRNFTDTLASSSDNLPVKVYGNLFQSNNNTGAVIHLYPARTFYFINNTVVSNGVTAVGQYSGIVMRGENPSSGCATDDACYRGGYWEIHNNLLYNNQVRSGFQAFDDPKASGIYTCASISGGFGSDNATTHNWVFNSGGTTGGLCAVAMPDPANKNILTTDPTNRFVGPVIAPNDPFALLGPLVPPTSTDGIDDGDKSRLTSDMPLFDLLGSNRIEPLNPPVANLIDIGAYEYATVRAGDVTVTGVDEDTLSVPITLLGQGGFPPYSFQITTSPAFYDVNPNNPCKGEAWRYNPTTQQVTICPPKNLYTIGAPPVSQLTFRYRAIDNSGNASENEGLVTVQITPTADTLLSDPITTSLKFESNKTGPTAVSFLIRPYVSFDDNFFYSEDGGPEDILGAGGAPAQNNTPGADYPYTYSFGAVQGTDQLGIAGQIPGALAAANAAGNSRLNLSVAQGVTGKTTFTYTVTGMPAVHTVTIEVVNALPYTGLHDDTSFAFDYTPNWLPIYSESAINNTLHQTNVVGERADFSFVGTGFALYMQGSSAGGFWELRVDDSSFNWNGSQVVTQRGITCRTTTTTGTLTNSAYLSNRSTTYYVVSCTRLRAGEAHKVSIINREARILSVDAIGILDDNAVLLPGFHEVTESQMQPLFFGWTPLSSTLASGGIAYSTTNPNIGDITFRFKGTGFAVGTILERTRTGLGASYDICIDTAPPSLPQPVCETFSGAEGGTTTALWNVYRPFYGFDPNVPHQVTINVTGLPAGTRMVIDSIVVFDRQPTTPLPIGTTEDDVRGAIVFGGGSEDSWVFDTNVTAASNRTLTSIGRVSAAGPFVGFQIPDTSDAFIWWRTASTRDSQKVRICVDRGQLDTADPQTTFCITRNLRTAGNPIVVRESDFGAAGWGSAWGPGNTHSVEIYSALNEPFNLDRIQVLDTDSPLLPGRYEQDVPGLRTFDNNAPTYTFDDGVPPESSFVKVSNTRHSGGSAVQSTEADEGVYFRFTGTGFSALFQLDTYGGDVRVCWLKNTGAPAAVNTVLTTGTCSVINNRNSAVAYQAARTFVGLENTTYAVVIQRLGTNYNPSTRTGNTMVLDAIHIYGEDWRSLDELTPLPNNGRYETSFVNRAANNDFLYYGAAWRSVSGRTAVRYSGSDYDQVSAFGAGLVFRTNNADTVRLIRDTQAGASPVRVCHAPYNTGTGIVDYVNYRCHIVINDGGTANQAIFNINLGTSAPHVVSLTTLTSGLFVLDAIELVNESALPPLTKGIYPETDPRLIYQPTDHLTQGWRNLIISSFVDRSAMQATAPGASVQFRFTGTGFSLFTLLDNLSSDSLLVNLNGSGANDHTLTLSSRRTSALYGAAHTVAGLPFDTYQVTITDQQTGTATRKFTVDGIEIYGDYPARLPAGIYDNPDANLTFGPGLPSTWTLNANAAANLNRTLSSASRYGSAVMFGTDGARSIALHHVGGTSTRVQVCGTLTTAPFTRTCSEQTLVGVSNRVFTFPAAGSYNVAVTNLDGGKLLSVDAIGVQTDPAALTPGLYQDSHPSLTYENGWPAATPLAESVATDRLVRSSGPGIGRRLSFPFSGTGFSIVLAENTATADTYRLCVETTPGTCNVINSILNNGNPTTARRLTAITVVGFAAGNYTVRLENNDAAKPVLFDRVDILGNPADIVGTITGGVENDDARIVYLPYFSFTPTANAAASAGSQHLGAIKGSLAYVELSGFGGSVIEYVRQTLASYGQTDVCTAAAGTNSFNCAPVATVFNNQAPIGYQQSAQVNVGGGSRWVALINTDGKTMPLDFIRPLNASLPLTAGYFEDTFFQPAADGSPGYIGTGWSAAPEPLPAASGGTVRSTTNVGDALLFEFNGTGFSIYFAFDVRADAVRICWRPGLDHTVAGTQAGTCREYDNQSAAMLYQAGRTITGLTAGSYTVSVQMLADNGIPAPHAPSALPITMRFDALRIYNDSLPSNALNTPGTRYETSFTNRLADDRFLYYGPDWRTVTGSAAARYSGGSYDYTATIGSGITFTTNNANALVIYRDTSTATAAMEVCATRTDTGARLCTDVPNKTPAGISQPVSVPLNNASYLGQHVVTIMTTGSGRLNLDALEIANSGGPLGAGRYEESHPGLSFLNGTITPPETAWADVALRSYSGGVARMSSDNEAELRFAFTGTGFAIGMPLDLFAGNVEICYDTNATWNDSSDRCYTYNNENPTASYTASRSVTALPAATYYVRVRNVEDSFPNTPPRNPKYAPARMVVDYVHIFGDAPPTAVASAGLYNEDARDGSGNPYLQLLPAARWNTFSGTAARGFSGLSYVGVVDDSKRLSALYAGAAANLLVQVPAEGATVVFYTGPAISTNTPALLVCANQVTGVQPPPIVPSNDCTIISTLRTSAQFVITPAALPALGNAGTVRLSVRALLPGLFRIDGFQIIHGTVLAPGLYDDFLFADGGLINTAGTNWTLGFKTPAAYGGTQARTQTRGATLNFEFQGTGFSVLTQTDTAGMELRICYKEFDSLTPFPADNNPLNQDGDVAAGDVICRTFTTNTTAALWANPQRNLGRPNPSRANQYGFAFYGLPSGRYAVQVREVDATTVTTRWLYVDAIAVFGAPTAAFDTLAVYDNTDSRIVYGPAPMWTPLTARLGPPRGPFQLTETVTRNVGALAQMRVTGNALILYQTAGSTGSRHVRFCLLPTFTGETMQCTEFSQSVRTTYFTPIAFYGFGRNAAHDVVIENWDNARSFSIDALQVLP